MRGDVFGGILIMSELVVYTEGGHKHQKQSVAAIQGRSREGLN